MQRRLDALRLDRVEGGHMVEDLLEMTGHGNGFVIGECQTGECGHMSHIGGGDARHGADLSTSQAASRPVETPTPATTPGGRTREDRTLGEQDAHGGSGVAPPPREG